MARTEIHNITAEKSALLAWKEHSRILVYAIADSPIPY